MKWFKKKRTFEESALVVYLLKYNKIPAIVPNDIAWVAFYLHRERVRLGLNPVTGLIE